jgi:hypothetical protein
MNRMEYASSANEFYSANKYINEELEQVLLELEKKFEISIDEEDNYICLEPMEKIIAIAKMPSPSNNIKKRSRFILSADEYSYKIKSR